MDQPEARRSVFVISPAHTGGRRCRQLLRADAPHALAVRLRHEGVPVGEIFTFISPTYFGNKLVYARRFAVPPPGMIGVWVIVPGMGLLPDTAPLDRAQLGAVARVPVDPGVPAYRTPLLAEARRLAAALTPEDVVVFLGSLATDRYLEPLDAALRPYLHFPRALLGLGAIRRGALLRRCVEENVPLSLTRRGG